MNRNYKIRVVCCECGADMDSKDGGWQPGLVSHGICDHCVPKVKHRIRRDKKKWAGCH